MVPKMSADPSAQETKCSIKEKLLKWQKFIRERILENPKFKWYRRAVWTISIGYACWLAIQSAPFYTAIGAGESAYKAGQYPLAEEKFKIALVESEKFSATDPRRAKALNNLAELYRTQGRFKEAEPLYMSTVGLAHKLGANREEYPLSISNLANFYRESGLYPESEEKYKQALDIWNSKVKKPQDVKLAIILTGYGKLARDQGK